MNTIGKPSEVQQFEAPLDIKRASEDLAAMPATPAGVQMRCEQHGANAPRQRGQSGMRKYRNAALAAVLLSICAPMSTSFAEKFLVDAKISANDTSLIGLPKYSCVLAYDSATGAFQLEVVNRDGGDDGTTILGSGFTLAWAGNGIKGFTHMVPLSIDFEPYHLAYTSATGVAYVNRVNPNCNGVATVSSGNLGKGWSHVVAFSIGAAAYVMTYDSKTGAAQINGIKKTIGFAPIWFGNLGIWSHLMPYSFNGAPSFMKYDTATGAAELWRFNANGAGVTQEGTASLGAGWTHLIPSPSSLDFITYSSTSGAVSFDRIDDNGKSYEILRLWQWSKGISLFATLYFVVPEDIASNALIPAFVPYFKSGEAQVWLFN